MKREMMRNRGFILVLILFSLISCSQNKGVTIENEKGFEFYKDMYPDYKDSIDPTNSYHLLVNYRDSNTIEEILVFDDSNRLIEYVFYNIVLEESRYLLVFNDSLKVKEQEGSPIYLTSEYFGNSDYARDSFSVYVHIATPPEFETYFTLYYLDSSGVLNKMNEHKVKDDHITMFKGLINSKNHLKEEYCIVSKIERENFSRIDTAWFSILIDRSNPPLPHD